MSREASPDVPFAKRKHRCDEHPSYLDGPRDDSRAVAGGLCSRETKRLSCVVEESADWERDLGPDAHR